MKITRVTSPTDIAPTSVNTSAHADARARAIEVLKGQAAPQAAAPQAAAPQEQQIVQNANQVQPEEMTAIQAPTSSEPVEVSDSNASTETPESVREQAKLDPETQRRLDQVAKQERAFRAKVQKQTAELNKRAAELQAKEESFKQPDLSEYVHKSRIKEDALSVIEEVGSNYDELTQQAMNRAPTDPRVLNHISKLEAKIQELEQKTVTAEKTQVEQQQAQYQAAVKQIRTDVNQLVAKDPEFETVRAMKAQKDVVELIEKTYAKDGIVLTVEEAAQEVENYLLEQALQASQLKKVKERQQKLSKPSTPEAKTPNSQQTQMKTLTNAASVQRPLTTRERAIAAMEGRLK